MSNELLEFFAPETAKKSQKPLETEYEVVIRCDSKEEADITAEEIRETLAYGGMSVREVVK